MQISTILSILVLASIEGRSIHGRGQGQTVRRTQPNIQLYSMETGRHLIISKRRISSTKKSNSKLAEIQFVSVSSSEFVIKGTQTGLYLSKAASGRSKTVGQRLKAVNDLEKATRFSEELIQENQFNKYRLGDNKDCHLALRRNGKPKISCRDQGNFAFLPRRVHQRVQRGKSF